MRAPIAGPTQAERTSSRVPRGARFREIMEQSSDRNDASSDPVAHAWEKVDRSWDDPDAHDRLLRLGHASGRLGEVGRRYREAASSPERRSTAERQIARIVALALADLVPTPRAQSDRPRKVLVAVGYVVVVALLAAIASLVLRSSP